MGRGGELPDCIQMSEWSSFPSPDWTYSAWKRDATCQITYRIDRIKVQYRIGSGCRGGRTDRWCDNLHGSSHRLPCRGIGQEISASSSLIIDRIVKVSCPLKVAIQWFTMAIKHVGRQPSLVKSHRARCNRLPYGTANVQYTVLYQSRLGLRVRQQGYGIVMDSW